MQHKEDIVMVLPGL